MDQYKISAFSGDEDRKYNPESQNNENQNQPVEVSSFALLNDYLTIISNENNANAFLSSIPELFTNSVFLSIEKEETAIFPDFRIVFFSQLSNLDLAKIEIISHHLYFFSELSHHYCQIFDFPEIPQIFPILLRFTEIKSIEINLHILTILINLVQLFPEQIYKFFVEHLEQLSTPKDDPQIFIKIINFYDRFINMWKPIAIDPITEINVIIRFFMQYVLEEFVTMEILEKIALLTKSILFCFPNHFISSLDKHFVLLFEYLISISLNRSEVPHSHSILCIVLESIRTLTSDRIPQHLVPHLTPLFEEFDLSLFGLLLSYPNAMILNLTISCSLNFLLCGYPHRFSPSTINCFLMHFYDMQFENQVELALFFLNYTILAPTEIKIAFMSDSKYLDKIFNIIVCNQSNKGLYFLEKIVELLKACIINDVLHPGVHEAFMNLDFLSLFDELESNTDLSTDEQITFDLAFSFCSELLLTPE